MNSTEPTYVEAGDIVAIELPYSEVCMAMNVAGQIRQVRFQAATYANGLPAPGYVAQILSDAGRIFSAPILPSEASFYRDGNGRYYTYLPAECSCFPGAVCPPCKARGYKYGLAGYAARIHPQHVSDDWMNAIATGTIC